MHVNGIYILFEYKIVFTHPFMIVYSVVIAQFFKVWVKFSSLFAEHYVTVQHTVSLCHLLQTFAQHMQPHLGVTVFNLCILITNALCVQRWAYYKLSIHNIILHWKLSAKEINHLCPCFLTTTYRTKSKNMWNKIYCEKMIFYFPNSSKYVNEYQC